MPAGLTDAVPANPARLTWLLIGLVTAASLTIRAIPLALSDFPVNDGGLFVAMTQAIEGAGWRLPETVGWNGEDLPFAYPPLAFYLAGVLEALGADLFGVFRWLPLLASSLIVPAVFLLGRDLLRSDIGGLVSALAYALAPVSFVWMIQGGGVTRSPGLLLAVLAIWQTILLVRRPSHARTLTVGVLAGATALVHPGAAVFAAASGVLLLLFEGRTRSALLHAAMALGIAGLLVLPWAAIVISRHGLVALTDVPSNGPDLIAALSAVLAGRVTGAPFLDPLAILGLALALQCLIRRRWLLPAWFFASLLLSYQYAMVPFGLLIGVAAVDLVRLRPSTDASTGSGAARWIPVIGVTVLAACLVIEGVAASTTIRNPGAPVHALSAQRRAAAEWVAANLEPDATFALITDSEWSGDQDSEWFPFLAGRRSLATVQGSEWLGRAAFDAQVIAHRALQACVRPASVSCVRDWLAEHPADFVYIPKGRLHGPASAEDCCYDLRARLLADPAVSVVLDDTGATIMSMSQALDTRIR